MRLINFSDQLLSKNLICKAPRRFLALFKDEENYHDVDCMTIDQRKIDVKGRKDFKFRPPPSDFNATTIFYNDTCNKAVNILMKDGLKEKARLLVNRTLMYLKIRALQDYEGETSSKIYVKELDPFYIFDTAVKNVQPCMNLIDVGKRGLIYKVPSTVRPFYARFMAIRWMIECANAVKNPPDIFEKRFSKEIYDTYLKRGNVMKKKNELLSKIEENKAFVTYRWS
ncbi:MAG: 28S ribosomal protein S7, mitochondrial [Marteilia pararefringens]